MSITKTKQGTYSVSVYGSRDFNGKRVRYRKTTKTLKEAKEIERDFKLKAMQYERVTSHVRFDEFVLGIYLPEKKEDYTTEHVHKI